MFVLTHILYFCLYILGVWTDYFHPSIAEIMTNIWTMLLVQSPTVKLSHSSVNFGYQGEQVGERLSERIHWISVHCCLLPLLWLIAFHFYSFSECLVDASFICFLSFAEGRSHLVIVFKHLRYRGFNHPLDMLSGGCESSMKPAHRDSKGTFH